MNSKLHLGKNRFPFSRLKRGTSAQASAKRPLHFNRAPILGEQVTLDSEEFYRIANYDRMRPFFMTVVSDADHWMFVSSNGALTAGRRNADLAVFPYYTDDKIRDMA